MPDQTVTASVEARDVVASGVPAEVVEIGVGGLETQFPTATPGDVAVRGPGTEWIIKQDAPVSVEDMAGTDFTDQFNNVLTRLKDVKGASIVLLPGGWQKIRDGFTLAEPGTPASISQLLNGVIIKGGRDTVLFWDDSTAGTGQVMFDFPAAYKLKIENFKAANRITAGTVTPDRHFFVHRPAYEWNVNTARSFVAENLVIDSFENGLTAGDQSGPDLTLATWRNCLFTQCQNAVVLEGANVAGFVFDNCQFGSTKPGAHAAHLKYSVPKFFDDTPANDRYTDLFGNQRAWNWTTTPTWLGKIFDSAGRDGNDASFDSTSARTVGGGPDAVFLNCNCTLSDTTQGTAQYAFLNESCQVYVDTWRQEGANSAIMQTKYVTGNPVFAVNAGKCSMVNVNAKLGAFPAYDLETDGTTNAGYALEINGGFYKNTTLPTPNMSTSKRVYWTGAINGPSGVIHSGTPYIIPRQNLADVDLQDLTGKVGHFLNTRAAAAQTTGFSGGVNDQVIVINNLNQHFYRHAASGVAVSDRIMIPGGSDLSVNARSLIEFVYENAYGWVPKGVY